MEILPSKIIYVEEPSPFWSPRSSSFLNQRRWVSFIHYRSHLLPQPPQIQKSIITCARNKRRQHGSARSIKLMLESAYYIASKFKILPEPLDFLTKEFGIGVGGNGGGFGFWKGSGWGGFDGWGRGGRRKKKKRMMEILGILVILGMGICLILGKEFDTNLVLWVLGLVLFGLSVDGWRKGVVKDWVLGFSSCAVLVGFSLKREDFQRLANSFLAMKMGRRSKRRAF